jgi:hypothetical protein
MTKETKREELKQFIFVKMPIENHGKIVYTMFILIAEERRPCRAHVPIE